jgi:hypothetical protein
VIVSLDEKGEAEREAAEVYGGISGSLWDLLNVYAESRARILRSHPEWNPMPQALLVIFTKADAHGGRLPGLDKYLEQQSYSGREERANISRMLRTWMERDQEAQGILNYARKNFARIEFCAVSATGGRTADGQPMDRRPRPCRVFDPLLWTWELTDELGRGRMWKWGRP